MNFGEGLLLMARKFFLNSLLTPRAKRYRHAYQTTAADRDRLQHAYQTTAVDRDRLQHELIDAQATIERLSTQLQDTSYAYETTMADRDRLAAELSQANSESVGLSEQVETFKHAFESTAVDRDHWCELVDTAAETHDRLILGLVAHILHREILVKPTALGERLQSVLDTLPLRGALAENAGPEKLAQAAAAGLLEATEVILRLANVSAEALDMVELSLALDPSFSDRLHSIDMYFQQRRPFDEHVAFYSRAVADGLWPDPGTRAAQQDAIGRDLPSMLMVTLPKSGSIYIWTTVSDSLRMPMFRVALTQSLTEETIVPALLEVFSDGGMTAQHHLHPSEENIARLKEAGFTRFIVHFRDPRQAAVSWWHYQLKIGAARERERSQEEIEEVIWLGYLEPAARWLQGWLDIHDNDPDFDLVLSTQEELAGREVEHISALLRGIGVPEDRISLEAGQRSGRTHFRKGAKDEWLSFYSDAFKKRSVDLVPNEIARRFGWCEVE